MKRKIFAIILALLVVVALRFCVVIDNAQMRGLINFFQDTSDFYPENFFPTANIAYFVSHFLLVFFAVKEVFCAFIPFGAARATYEEYKSWREEKKREKTERKRAKLQAQIEENKAKLQEMEKAE